MSEQSSVINGVKTIELTSWKKFYNLIEEEFSNKPAYIFRGQSDATWKIESSLDRLEIKYPRSKNFSSPVPEYFDCTPTDGGGPHCLDILKGVLSSESCAS
jgi:hypothetical protein